MGSLLTRRGSKPILVSGGATDPHVQRLLEQCAAMDVEVTPALLTPESNARFTWDLQRDELRLDGDVITPSAVFHRPDVFGTMTAPGPTYGFRVGAWSTALSGWVMAHPEVVCVNRGALESPTNKVEVLVRAARLGLRIPRTVVTNDHAIASALDAPWVVKPINGGALTRPVADALAASAPRAGALPAPAILQEKLSYPEARVYVVGDAFVAYRIESPHIDYRDTHEVSITHLPTFASDHQRICAALRALAGEMGLNFAAADLKSHPETGELVFLEINSMPMFARFDTEAGGALSRALVRLLAGAASDRSSVARHPVVNG